MTALIIKSDNPDFSYLLEKNPSSPPFTKSLRKGKVTGFFNGTQSYCVHFTDHPTEVIFSHKNSDFEYLDRTRYTSSLALAMSVSTALRSALQRPNDEPEFPCVAVTAVELNHPKLMKRIGKELGLEFLPTQEGSPVGLLSLKETQVGTLLRKLVLFCIIDTFHARGEEDPLFVELELLKKYAQIAVQLDAPFYVRYLFLRQVESPKDFEVIRSIVSKPGEIFNFGSTRLQRFSAIKDILKGGKDIYDFGCGELYQTAKLSRSYTNVFSIDSDEGLQEINKHYVARKKLENVTLLTALPEILEEGCDILASEVIEHIPLEETGQLFSFLSRQDFANLVITVPNKEFNVWYGLGEEEMRHPDHKWEPTKVEFEQLIMTGFPSHTVRFYGVGDSVNGVHTSLMAHITK